MVHCQNCTTKNAMTRQFCWKCGTRLLVASGAYGAEGSMSSMDEHVLERISAMEYAVSMLTKRLDTLVEAIDRVAANSFIDHTMIETLTESLESAGVNLSNLEAEWRKRIDERLSENEEADRLGERMDRIIDFYRGSRRKQFRMWIERAYELLVSERTAESLSSLQTAFRHDPANYELGMLISEVFFQAKEFGSACECLSQVLQTKPDHFEATLLMGFLQKRHGNHHEAQRLLELAVKLREDSPSAHATLGAHYLDRGNRPKALDHLNRALELKPTAPTHFMLGAVYYQDGRQRRAISHLKRATELDPQFGEAFYQLGLLCQEMKWRRKARECFRRAQNLDPREHRYRQAEKQAEKMVPGFSEGRINPDQLGGLVREELHLMPDVGMKRPDK